MSTFLTEKTAVADAHDFLQVLAAWAKPVPQPKVTETTVCTLLAADKAGKAVAATLSVPQIGRPDEVVVVYAFATATKERLLALGAHADRWATTVRVTATTNAKGYRNVKQATDVELLRLTYRPRPVPTFAQHLGRYVVALGQKLQGHGAPA